MNTPNEDSTPNRSPCDIIASGYTSPVSSTPSPSSYRKLPLPEETYLAYVVAIRDPLNLHLDIYWPPEIERRYGYALNYEYTFVSEELATQIYARNAYSCHLKGVEIISPEPNDFGNMKEAYISISKRITQSGGWILVSVGDIDVYRRVLIHGFDVIDRQSLNQELLDKVSARTGMPIAQEYARPSKNRKMFLPKSDNLPKDYHIVFPKSQKIQEEKFKVPQIPNSLVQK